MAKSRGGGPQVGGLLISSEVRLAHHHPQVHIDVVREQTYAMDPISSKLSDTELYTNGKQNEM